MRIKPTLMLLALTLTLSGVALGQDDTSNAKEFAHGNGTVEFEGKVSNFSFTAIRQKDGTVKGNLVYNQRSATNPANNLSVHMRINCLTIVGKTATIQGVITKSDPEFVLLDPDDPTSRFDLVGASASLTVQDEVRNQNTGEVSDMASSLIVTGAPIGCQAIYPPFMYRTTNVVVRGGAAAAR
ncbi:MAG TPA: hypothetical protein VF668_07030 [Pyrinomonadaceae bacterium]